jgi:DNA-binding CsgD family transcriptional regulator
MKEVDSLNYLAIEFLERLGNNEPSQTQIDLVESILSNSAAYIKMNVSNKLTSREITCLYWAAHGMTSQETADLLNISPSTVESHRKGIKRKLNCVTITEAVFQGMIGGYLSENCCTGHGRKVALNANVR